MEKREEEENRGVCKQETTSNKRDHVIVPPFVVFLPGLFSSYPSSFSPIFFPSFPLHVHRNLLQSWIDSCVRRS